MCMLNVTVSSEKPKSFYIYRIDVKVINSRYIVIVMATVGDTFYLTIIVAASVKLSNMLDKSFMNQ